MTTATAKTTRNTDVTPITKASQTRRTTKPAAKSTPKSTAKKASPAPKKAALPAKYTDEELAAMPKVARMNLAKLERQLVKDAAAANKPKPSTPVSDWYARQGESVPEPKSSKSSRRTSTRPQVTDAERLAAIDRHIAAGMHTWTKVARQLQKDRMGQSHLVVRPIIQARLDAAGVTKTPKTAKPAAKKVVARKATPKTKSATKAKVAAARKTPAKKAS